MQMCVHPVTAQPLPEPWCWSSAHTQTEEDGGWLHPLGEPWEEAPADTTQSLCRGDSVSPERTQLLSPISEHGEWSKAQAPLSEWS